MRVFNKKTTQHSITLMLVLLGTGYNLNAEVYRWKDSKGVTHYSDRPPSSITAKKSDELLLKIIKNDNYCANPSPEKAEVQAIDHSNSYFFNVVKGRLQPQITGIGAIGANNNRNMGITAPTAFASPTSSSAGSASSAAFSASPSVSQASAGRATPTATPRVASPAVAGLPLNAFRPFGFNTVTKSTPNGVSISRLNSISLAAASAQPVTAPTLPLQTPSATPAPAQTPAQTTTSTSAVPADTKINLAVATPAPTESNKGSLMPAVDIAKTPSGDVGYNTVRIKPATHDGVHDDKLGAFRTNCKITHYGSDDPIIYPGLKGASHHHTFFGNVGANYASTPESIRTTGNSSCDGGTLNRTGYWIPSIIDTRTGAPLKPSRGLIYYKTGVAKPENIQPFPKNLRMIAGNPQATLAGNSSASFVCVDESIWSYTGQGKVIPFCKKSPDKQFPPSYIRLKVVFPSCWDGKNLDSPDHKSHMAYPKNSFQDNKGDWHYLSADCPATHPISVPEITEIFDFDVTDPVHGTDNWRLSSDNYPTTTRGGLSLHADWMNGWDEKIMSRIVKNCLNKSVDCGVNYLGDGETLY